MSVVSDWTKEAAKEITEMVLSYDVQEVRAIIKKYCPVDGAYILVPRCDMCKHWGPFTSVNGIHKECRVDPPISPEQMDEFMPAGGFGCVRWEKKL